MDLNTALMESITSMSEYFVAANTRTSFTDLADSNPMNHAQNSSHSIGVGPPNQHQQNSSSLSQQQQFIHGVQNGSQSAGGKILASATSNQLVNQAGANATTTPTTTANPPASALHSNHCNQNHTYHNHSYSTQNAAINTSAGMQSRLSQPIRTQIPIHCYIEQLNASAEITSYQSPLNDSDLFNTTNRTTTTNQISNHHHNHMPHLHQSKLALESVTNGTSLASITNSSSIFNENDTNNNDNNDLDATDASLDHLNPTSPLSINQSNLHSSVSLDNIHSHSLCGNNGSNIDNSRLASSSSSYDSQHFQSCRETYAIVTSNVLYIDLVRTVLLQLGYSAMDLINAKATIQMKNWRPLSLDQVTEDKSATVGEVLGDISTFVTLRIRLYSSVTQLPTEWTETMIRQVVLALTQTMSQLTLSKLCNISQPLISSIVRGGKKLGRRKCAEFGQWYLNYIKTAEARPSTMFCEGGGARLVFDKSREIPQLKAWFANNTKPSDEVLEEYSRMLNEHALRKDRPQVTAKALKNWWKNERQKLGIRQREIRGRPKLKRID